MENVELIRELTLGWENGSWLRDQNDFPILVRKGQIFVEKNLVVGAGQNRDTAPNCYVHAPYMARRNQVLSHSAVSKNPPAWNPHSKVLHIKSPKYRDRP